MRQREEDLNSGVENTWHRINEPVGQMTSWHRAEVGFMVDVNTHPHCLAKGILPLFFLACYCYYCLKHSCRFPRITVASHVAAAAAKALKSRRSMYCPAQCALQQAPCVHPWAQTAINQFSNWCHRSYWWQGILTQLYTQQLSRQQKKSSCRVFSFKLARVFLKISGQSTIHTGNVKTSQWYEEAYHQYPTRLLPT